MARMIASMGRVALLASCIAASASTVEAQSLFNAAGLGLPGEALDGRARALGSLGIGLTGSAIMPTDPAALATLGVSTAVMAASPIWVNYSAAGNRKGNFRGTRFPLLGLAYPVFGGMAAVQVGSFLDQGYEITRVGQVNVGNGPLQTTDDFTQDGSVSNVNLGFARRIGSRYSAGITLGRYAGNIDRALVRTYGDEDETGNIDTYAESGVWSWTGRSVTIGGAANLPGLRLAASVQIPSGLDAEASDDTRGGDGSFSLPTQYRLGASANVGPNVIVHASTVLADWSGTQDDLSSGAFAHDGNGFGVGVELSRARLLGKDAPLRFGFRRTGLPFAFDDTQVMERSFSAGFGLTLNETAGVVLGGIDLSIERGQRRGANLTEHFWRATLSLLTSGF